MIGGYGDALAANRKMVCCSAAAELRPLSGGAITLLVSMDAASERKRVPRTCQSAFSLSWSHRLLLLHLLLFAESSSPLLPLHRRLPSLPAMPMPLFLLRATFASLYYLALPLALADQKTRRWAQPRFTFDTLGAYDATPKGDQRHAYIRACIHRSSVWS